MATITSAQTGNFTATSTWVGGVVPGANDTAVAASGHVIAIDADITVGELRTANTSGYFTLGNGRTLTGNVRGGSTVALSGTLVVTATTTATIIGDILQDQGTTSTVVVIVSSTANGGTLNIQGNVTGGAGLGRYAVNIPAASTLNGYTINVTGAVNSGSQPMGYGVALEGGTNITLNVTGNVGVTNPGTAVFVQGTTPTIGITGTVRGSSATVGYSAVYFAPSGGTLGVTGDIIGAASSTSGAVATAGSNNVTTINGNASLTTNSGYAMAVGAGTSAIINGNIVGGPNNQTVQNAGTLTVNGNVSGGATSGTGAGIVHNNAAAVTTVNGTITGASGAATGAGINMSNVGGTVTANGDITATNNSSAVIGTEGVLLLAANAAASANGRPAFVVPFMRFTAPATKTISVTSYNGTNGLGALADGTDITMASVAAAGYPSAADVRAGTSYAAGAYTGTLAVPNAVSVAYGVPVDATTGTASLSQAALVAAVGAQIAAATTAPA